MWFNDTVDRDVGGLGRNILGKWEEWYSFRVSREISTLHIKRYDTGEWYNYRFQNWKNVISLSFLSFPTFSYLEPTFQTNSQKKIRKECPSSTPIKTFRFFDWRLNNRIHLLHTTFRQSIELATLREREQEIGVKAKWFFERSAQLLFVQRVLQQGIFVLFEIIRICI